MDRTSFAATPVGRGGDVDGGLVQSAEVVLELVDVLDEGRVRCRPSGALGSAVVVVVGVGVGTVGMVMVVVVVVVVEVVILVVIVVVVSADVAVIMKRPPAPSIGSCACAIFPFYPTSRLRRSCLTTAAE